MNRGGLAGTRFEMDDSFTSCSAERLAELRCDGGKMMYRLDAEDPASGRTILACAEAVNALRRQGLAAFLEPLGVSHEGYVPAKDAATTSRRTPSFASANPSYAMPRPDEVEALLQRAAARAG